MATVDELLDELLSSDDEVSDVLLIFYCVNLTETWLSLASNGIYCAQGPGSAQQQGPVAAAVSDSEHCCIFAVSLLCLHTASQYTD